MKNKKPRITAFSLFMLSFCGTFIIIFGIYGIIEILGLFKYISSICVDGSTSAFAWQDVNSNGILDAGEPPLQGVCISSFHSEYFNSQTISQFQDNCQNNASDLLITDDNGHWSDIGFSYGGCFPQKEVSTRVAEQCSEMIILAYAPKGYIATTKTQVNACSAEFGFIIEK